MTPKQSFTRREGFLGIGILAATSANLFGEERDSLYDIFKPETLPYHQKMVPLLGTYGRPGPYANALEDIKDRGSGNVPWESSDDLGHETVHGINGYIRRHMFRQGIAEREKRVAKMKEERVEPGEIVTFKKDHIDRNNRVGAFYVLDGKFARIYSPHVSFSQFDAEIPPSLKTIQRPYTSYKTYVRNGSQFGSMVSPSNNEFQPNAVFDEFTAYIAGGEVSLDLGRRKSLRVEDFMSYVLALNRATKKHDQPFWESRDGEDFRTFTGFNLERAMNVHVRQTVREGDSVGHAYRKLHSYTTPALREFTKRTFGDTWAGEVLGFN